MINHSKSPILPSFCQCLSFPQFEKLPPGLVLGEDQDEDHPHEQARLLGIGADPSVTHYADGESWKPRLLVAKCGGELPTDRLGGLVHPRYFSGRTAPTKIYKNQGCFTHLNDPWDEPPSVFFFEKEASSKEGLNGIVRSCAIKKTGMNGDSQHALNFWSNSPMHLERGKTEVPKKGTWIRNRISWDSMGLNVDNICCRNGIQSNKWIQRGFVEHDCIY